MYVCYIGRKTLLKIGNAEDTKVQNSGFVYEFTENNFEDGNVGRVQYPVTHSSITRIANTRPNIAKAATVTICYR